MMRNIVITGSASGIGLATRKLLESQGDRVIGVDLRDADIVADLSTPEGRAHAVREAPAMTSNVMNLATSSVSRVFYVSTIVGALIQPLSSVKRIMPSSRRRRRPFTV